VHRMAQSSYDYDLLTYDVISRSAYASSSHYYGSSYYDDWCTFSCGRPYFGRSPFSVSIGLFYGRPYRRYYYDPYYYAYDPFYNPFFYDPYYYAPTYYPRYVYPRRYYGYSGPYYYDRHRTYERPYTPYRFRGSDGFTAGYRDRRYDVRRAVNTVYHPPVSPIREPAASHPVRRVTEDPAELPRGLAPRRSVGYESRSETKPVEGRRAREREAPDAGAAPARREVQPRAEEARDQPRVQRTREETRPVERTREEPRRVERAREEPRTVERPRQEPRPVQRAPAQGTPQRREVERSSAPPQSRGAGQGESRGAAQPSHSSGGRRR
jgi:hypothetical protein